MATAVSQSIASAKGSGSFPAKGFPRQAAPRPVVDRRVELRADSDRILAPVPNISDVETALGEEVLDGLLVREGGLDGPVEDDSGAAGETHLCGDLDRCDMPSAVSVDQQRSPADTTGSRATVAQQEPAARIDKAPADAALSIRHQKKRMILLVAAEHHAGPVLRQVI